MSALYATAGFADRFDIYIDNARGGTDIVRVDGAGHPLVARPLDYDYRRAGLIQAAIVLHQTLFAGDGGKLFLGFSALILLINIVMGLTLAWPRRAEWRRGVAADNVTRPSRQSFFVAPRGWFMARVAGRGVDHRRYAGRVRRPARKPARHGRHAACLGANPVDAGSLADDGTRRTCTCIAGRARPVSNRDACQPANTLERRALVSGARAPTRRSAPSLWTNRGVRQRRRWPLDRRRRCLEGRCSAALCRCARSHSHRRNRRIAGSCAGIGRGCPGCSRCWCSASASGPDADAPVQFLPPLSEGEFSCDDWSGSVWR